VRTFVAIAVLVSAAWLLIAISPTGASAIHLPAGFEAVKVTTPDLVAYPMMGTLDDRGRLFICESSGNTLNDQQMAAHPDYRIRMLEDRDGDGVFDHATTFAEHLTLPAGAVWYRGSLYVASPPDLFRFTDTDGDGVADKREVVVTGWVMASNAASLHGPFFGPDGYLYLTDGRHGFDIKAVDGREYKGKSSRIWRIRPDGTGLEWFAGGGFDNPVELVFTPSGETIGTMTYFKDPANGERDALLHFVEGGVYPKWYRVVDEFKRTGDLMPVMTKFARIAPAGLMRYRGAAFGPQFQGNLFSAQFNPHRIQRHILFREGSSYRTEDSDFLTSTDPDFHPTDVLEDADGSLLVMDTGAWFIHGCPISRVAKPEIKGGVYRIRRKSARRPDDPRGEKLNLAAMSPAELVKSMADPRPAVQDKAIEQLVAGGHVPATPLHLTPALVFALFRMGTPEAQAAVRSALSHPSADVRTAAARCVGMAKDSAAVDRLMAIVRKDLPAPRRQAAAALGQIGDVRAVPALLAAAANPEDRYVEHSVIYSLIELNQPDKLSVALTAPQPKVRKAALIALDQVEHSPLQPAQAVPLLNSKDKDLRTAAIFVTSHHPDWAGQVVEFLSQRLHDPTFGGAEGSAVRDAFVAFAADAGAQKLVGDLLRDRSLGPKQLTFLLDTLDALPLKQFPEPWIPSLGELIEGRNARALDLVRTRGIAGVEPSLNKIADDPTAPAVLRVSAISALVTNDPHLTDARFDLLAAKLDPRTDAVLRQSAAQILARSALDKDKLLLLAAKYLPKADALTLATTIDCFRASRDPEAGAALVGVLKRSPAVLGTLGEQHLKTLIDPFPEPVRKSAAPLFQALHEAEKNRIQRLQKLEPLLTAGGDVGRGRRIFFGEKVACYSCHTIGQEGGHVGPDLTGVGAIRSGHDLLEAVVFPSASFVPGFEIFNVTTATDTLAGLIRSQSADAVVLVTGPNEVIRIPRARIKRVQRSTVSLMPEGFDESLTTPELTDLLAFLQAEKNRPKP
jgi:putative membrane-bound dehydrogenase-like protein